MDLVRSLEREGFEVTLGRHLEAVQVNLETTDLLILDLETSALRSTTPTGARFVEGFRFFRRAIPILTFCQAEASVDSPRLADLDVDWHFTRRPNPRHLAIHASRSVARRRQATEPEVLQLDAAQRIVRYGARSVRVSPQEYAFLEMLLANVDRPVPRDEAIQTLWVREPPASDRAIDVLAFKVRRKLAADLGLPDAVVSVRGVGYRFVLRPAVEPPVPDDGNAPNDP